jgi:hypothetical protein
MTQGVLPTDATAGPTKPAVQAASFRGPNGRPSDRAVDAGSRDDLHECRASGTDCHYHPESGAVDASVERVTE